MAEKNVMSVFSAKPRLTDRLVRAGLLARDQARRVVEESTRSEKSVCEILLRLNLIEETKLVQFLADRLEVPVLGPESLCLDQSVLELLPESDRARHDLLPLRKTGRTLSMAMADPSDTALIDRLAKQTCLKILPMLAPLSALHELHRRAEALESMRHQSKGNDDLSRYIPFFEKLTDYRLERSLGRGGFGLVCLCYQKSLDRHVAIKALNPDWNPVQQVAERFRREGQIIAKLDHPNIIGVFEQGERDGIHYIVMEYFEGKPLSEYLSDKDWGRRFSVLIQVCNAIGCAHDCGVIHRDIKPANILVNDLGAVKLLDFGVAHSDAGRAVLTGPQVILGTPKYMAPELAQGADRTSRTSDIYAFGVMAYEILTGRKFEPGHLRHPSQVVEQIPAFLGDTILSCLSGESSRRPQSFKELASRFQKAMDQMVFGETSVVVDQPGARAPVNKIQALESRFDCKATLRLDRRTRTIVAQNSQLGRDVIVKILEAPDGVDHLQDFAELKHVHIGEIYSVGKHDKRVLIIGEHLNCGSLARYVERDNAPLQVVDWLEGVVQALRHAQKAHLAHGHLHPDNVMIGEEGGVKVIDFGLTCGSCEEWVRYRPRKPGMNPFERDRFALNALSSELISAQPYRGGLAYMRHFGPILHNPKIHPLLKYFLGRLWGVTKPHLPYEDYDEMLTDLRRIRNRLADQPDWAAEADATNNRSQSPQPPGKSLLQQKLAAVTAIGRGFFGRDRDSA